MHAHQHTTATYGGHPHRHDLAPTPHAHGHALPGSGHAGASIEKWATVADLLALEARLMAHFGDAVAQVVGALKPPQVAAREAPSAASGPSARWCYRPLSDTVVNAPSWEPWGRSSTPVNKTSP